MTTIMEALLNAQINLLTNRANAFAFAIGENQLNTAVALLEKGYPADTNIDALLEEFERIDRVPDYPPPICPECNEVVHDPDCSRRSAHE